ncbi:DUF2326 domain-containing protein [Rhizobium aegyptiacum]|uniref:DUF2326 domain-containing protein n=1 Tax=Rhizobium aegyptiacum TaxID=1764550 RepID=UPI0007E55371|nr:DUF2326 domain-containing protein [Rhizobium aegyptiacum]
MILALGSSIEGFKTLRFHKGLNILLAEQETNSEETKTRNSSGKSSVLDLVHFLLGGSIRNSVVKAQALQGHSFWGEFEFNGITFRVERRVSDPKTVQVSASDMRGLVYEGNLLGDATATNQAWCEWLGHIVFELPENTVGTPFSLTHAPTFRSMFPYFARRRDDIGFQYAEKFAAKAQSDGSAQIALSYLLGLDWLLARDFELERGEKRDLAAQSKRIKARRSENLETSSAIRSAMTLAAHEAEVQRTRIASFQVAEHYDEMVSEASQAKNLLEKLSVEAASLKSSLDFIEESLEAEKPGDGEAIAALYRAAGTELPGSVVKSFEDIAAFHQSVADNRRFHLSSQLDSIRRRISAVSAEMDAARARRDEILRDLRGKGAFSDLAAMQKVAAEKAEKHARLQTQYEEALEVEAGRAASRIKESNLLARLQNDLRTREATVSAMVLAVLEAKKALYADRGASFEVQATVNGPHFRVNIDGSRSGGIANMEVFCFDYALYKLTTARLGGPGFLIHDSHLFDPVDSRQIATSIQLGSGLVDEVGGQYIVMLNTDMFERLPFDEHFDVTPKVLPVRLNDTDSGGLFGFRFK